MFVDTFRDADSTDACLQSHTVSMSPALLSTDLAVSMNH